MGAAYTLGPRPCPAAVRMLPDVGGYGWFRRIVGGYAGLVAAGSIFGSNVADAILA